MSDNKQSYSISRWVLASKKDEIESLVSKWQKKAQQLGLAEPRIRFTGAEKFEKIPVYDLSDGMPSLNAHLVPTVPALKKEVVFSGEIPKMKGFQFLAKIEHAKNEDNTYSNLVFSPSSEAEKTLSALNKSLHVCTPDCDHCDAPRFRKTTFIVHDPIEGKTRQVGSTCIDDFIGKKTLQQIMAAYDPFAFFTNEEIWDEFDREYSATYDTPKHFPATSLIELADFYTSNFGFHRADEIDSTKNRMLGALAMERHEPPAALDIIRRAFDDNGDADTLARATQILDWVKKLDNPTGNNYISNIKSITKNENININTKGAIGIIASIPAAYERHMLMVERKNANKKNEFFGTVKSRGPLKLKLIKVKSQETRFGLNQQYTLLDDENRTFSWKASSDALHEIKIGEHVELTATIKGFYDCPYNNVKYTNLSICKNIMPVPADHPVPDFEAGAKKRTFKDTFSFTPSHLDENGENLGQGRMIVERSWREKGKVFSFKESLPLDTTDVDAMLISLISWSGAKRDEQSPRDVKKDHDFLDAGTKAFSLYNKFKKPTEGVLYLVDDAYAPILSGAQLKEGRRSGTPNERMQVQPRLFLREEVAIAHGRKNHGGRLMKIRIPYWDPVLTPSSLLMSSENELSEFRKEASQDQANALVFIETNGTVKRVEPINLSSHWLSKGYEILDLKPVHSDINDSIGSQSSRLLRGFKTATITGLENDPELMRKAKANLANTPYDEKDIMLDRFSKQDTGGSEESRLLTSSLQFFVSQAEKNKHGPRLLGVTDAVTSYYLEKLGADNVNIHIQTPNTVSSPSKISEVINYHDGMLDDPKAFIEQITQLVDNVISNDDFDLKRARLAR